MKGEKQSRVTPAQTDEPTDDVLLSRIGQGDLAAFELLYNRYYDYVMRFVLRTTRRVDIVEELVNDVMLVVWQRAPTLVLTVRPTTWILAVAYKKCLKALSLGRSREKDIPIDELPESWFDQGDSVSSEVEIENWVEAAFDLLPPEQRAAMELVYYHGMHYTEIASILECPENTVKTRIFHARKRLRAALPKLGGKD